MRWVEHAACMEEIKNAYKILVGRPDGQTPLGRCRQRWEDNLRIDLREIGWEGVEWMYLVQDRKQWQALVNMVMKLQVP
jgi:hypothetical protein